MSEQPSDVTTQVMEQPAKLEYPRIELVVSEGPDTGLRKTLDLGGMRIGTAPSNELPLRDRTVSRFHCEVRIVGNAVRLVDSGSTNGTLVDGVRVRDAELTTGSKVRVGATVLTVSASGERALVDLSPRHSFGEVLGVSVEMRRLYAILEKIAPTDTTVLIQGETGCGKELVARAIHDASARSQQPFVVVDCGAIAENLIESELFGHVRGAFSGAVGDRRGLFEEADGGTLFLDEIGELPAALQPKLLRVLETGDFERVGSSRTRHVNVRIVSATNSNLGEEVAAGRFRQDLLFRLNTVEINLPPLRERREDIPALANHFLRQHAQRYRKNIAGFDAAALQALLDHPWPGNIRELDHAVERGVLMAQGEKIRLGELGLRIDRDATSRIEDMSLEDVEGFLIKKAMARFDGNVSQAAKALGLSRSALYRRLQRYGL